MFQVVVVCPAQSRMHCSLPQLCSRSSRAEPQQQHQHGKRKKTHKNTLFALLNEISPTFASCARVLCLEWRPFWPPGLCIWFNSQCVLYFLPFFSLHCWCAFLSFRLAPFPLCCGQQRLPFFSHAAPPHTHTHATSHHHHTTHTHTHTPHMGDAAGPWQREPRICSE